MVKPKFSQEAELNNVDPGQDTKTQDCSTITHAFEKGAVHEPSEAATFAPLARYIHNNISFASTAKTALTNYRQQTANIIAGNTTGMKLKDQFIAIPDVNDGSLISKAVKECIPCLDRIVSSIDLRVSSSLLNTFKLDIKHRLDLLARLKDLFSDMNIYGDYCHLIALFNSMCLPDLQRMLLLLMALIADMAGDLFKLTNFLVNLIMPFFAPVLMGISTLLDQLVQLVLSPLDCIITSINQQIRKIDIGTPLGNPTLTLLRQDLRTAQKTQVEQPLRQFQGQVRSGLMLLNGALIESNTIIRNKLFFYTNQLNKLLSNHGLNSFKMISLTSKKLATVRLINLVKAIITAKGKGFVCKGPTPSKNELNTFFDTFLSPYSPYNMSIDENGDLHISLLKSKGLNVTAKSTLLPVAPTEEVRFSQTIHCNIKTSPSDAEKVNEWIAQLNKINGQKT